MASEIPSEITPEPVVSPVSDAPTKPAEPVKKVKKTVAPKPKVTGETTDTATTGAKPKKKKVAVKSESTPAPSTADAASDATPKPKKKKVVNPAAESSTGAAVTQATPKKAATASTKKPLVAAKNEESADTPKDIDSTPSPAHQPRTRQPKTNLLSALFSTAVSGLVKHTLDRDGGGASESHDHDDNNDDDDDVDGDDEDDNDDGQDGDEKNDADDHDDHDQHERDRDEMDQDTQHHSGAARGASEDAITSVAGAAANAAVGTAAANTQPGGRPEQQPNNTGAGQSAGKTSAKPEPKQQPKVSVKQIPNDASSAEKEKAMEPPTPTASSSSRSVTFVEFLVKFINLLLPLLFIVLAILRIVNIGAPEDSQLAQATEEANKIAITLWPIMFAAIAAQSLKAYATFQAERGIKLMTLEQLMHSSSFSSAIRQPLLLRRVDIMSLLLFVLWALSPLASQCLQRIAFTVPGSAQISQNFYYYAPTSQSSNAAFGGASNVLVAFRPAMFSSAMLTALKVALSPRDNWDNPKIPVLRRLVQEPSADGWLNVVGQGDHGVQFSSLMGLPLANLAIGSDSNFPVNASYLDFQCSDPVTVPLSTFNKTTKFIPGTHSTPTFDLWLASNYTTTDSPYQLQNGSYKWGFLKDVSQVVAGVDTAFANDSLQFVTSDCTWQTVAVTAMMQCVYSADTSFSYNPLWTCNATKLRSRQLLDTDASISPYYFAYNFLQTNPGSVPGTPGLQGLYLQSPHTFQSAIDSFDTTSGELFGDRVTELMNSFWLAGANQQSLWFDGSINNPDQYASLAQTSGNSVNVDPVWAISPVWLALFFFCDVMILFLAIADIIWEFKTISPDFLGFASSVVRGNQHLRKEMQNRKLSGHERTRAMADMNVMLQDVNANTSGRGKIALAPKNAGAVRLRRDREYM